MAVIILHEASLVQGLLDLSIRSLEDYNAGNPEKRAGEITEISCGAGLLASFEERTLKACFEIFAEDTPARNASLVIKTLPLDCQCSNCGARFELLEKKFACPFCKSDNIRFKGGHGLILLGINVNCEDESNE